MSNKVAFISGITGQDSSHLAELLLEKDYKVFGLIRRSSTNNTWRLHNVIDKIELIQGDLTDQSSLNKAIALIKPDEIYNMGAMSMVRTSWEIPETTFDVNANGVIRLLEAIRAYGKKETKMYQASTSEMFGKVQETPQKETTPFYPRSIYGVSKLAAHWACINYRESYNMFISCGIAFNHESHRRSTEFLTRKVALGVAKISLGMESFISLGNLDSKRDWGYAPDFVEAFWKILQLETPEDMVLATGETHTIRKFVQSAFKYVGIDNWQDYIKQDPKFMRPAEVDLLLGDSTKAKRLIGWQPKTTFKELVEIMVSSDLERLKRGDKWE
jgi:GDPmannose 4,6-dehydratase